MTMTKSPSYCLSTHGVIVIQLAQWLAKLSNCSRNDRRRAIRQLESLGAVVRNRRRGCQEERQSTMVT